MPYRCRQELIGRKLKYLFFWGHRAQADGAIGPSCLSQWFPAPFELEGVAYPTAEHYMMAEKARRNGDGATLALILASRSPAEAKALGRQVQPFDAARWNLESFDAVVRGNLAKFGQNPELKRFILATGQRVLVEASPVDRIWGIGLAHDDPAAGDPERWLGENRLGFALMEVRARLSGQVGQSVG